MGVETLRAKRQELLKAHERIEAALFLNRQATAEAEEGGANVEKTEK